MPPCKNDPKASYKGDEPSPKGLGYCAHAEKVGTVKKGKDGKSWVIQQTAKKVKRWVKASSASASSMDCSKFVSYEKSIKKAGFTVSTRLTGLELEKGKIYKWISYNKFATKPTVIPTGSGWKKKNFSSTIREEYYCGKKKEVKANNEKYASIRSKHKGWKTYFTHDNGGRPYCVYVSSKGGIVDVYKADKNTYPKDDDYGKIYTYTELVKSFKAKEVFVGKSPLNETKRASFHGNTILLKITPTQYVYIGNKIKSFETKKEIMKYVSPVGSADVPYPYGIDTEGRYYLISENVMVENVPMEMRTEPYDYYYKLSSKKMVTPLQKVKILDKGDW